MAENILYTGLLFLALSWAFIASFEAEELPAWVKAIAVGIWGGSVAAIVVSVLIVIWQNTA